MKQPTNQLLSRTLANVARRTGSLVAIVATVALVSGPGCEKKKDSKPGTGGGGGAWLVGAGGFMTRIDPAGKTVSNYDLGSDVDLNDIACRGATDAWVVGERGTLLRTFDGGDSWEALSVGIDKLRSVAAAAQDTVYVAGEGGLMVSFNSGDSWESIPEAERDWLKVATDASGMVALATTQSGDIYRFDAKLNVTERVWRGAGEALRDISMSSDRSRAVAVGDGGQVIRSTDRGYSWIENRVDAESLHAVQLASDGHRAIAVGTHGVVAELLVVDGSVTTAGVSTLRALHISADGSGLVVGDDGAVWQTVDAGANWEPVSIGSAPQIRGVDALHGEPHL